jgi:hypothetical protein
LVAVYAAVALDLCSGKTLLPIIKTNTHRSTLHAGDLLRLRLRPYLFGGVKLIPNGWNCIKKRDPNLGEIKQPVLSILRFVYAEKRIPRFGADDEPALRSF